MKIDLSFKSSYLSNCQKSVFNSIFYGFNTTFKVLPTIFINKLFIVLTKVNHILFYNLVL